MLVALAETLIVTLAMGLRHRRSLVAVEPLLSLVLVVTSRFWWLLMTVWLLHVEGALHHTHVLWSLTSIIRVLGPSLLHREVLLVLHLVCIAGARWLMSPWVLPPIAPLIVKLVVTRLLPLVVLSTWGRMTHFELLADRLLENVLIA